MEQSSSHGRCSATQWNGALLLRSIADADAVRGAVAQLAIASHSECPGSAVSQTHQAMILPSSYGRGKTSQWHEALEHRQSGWCVAHAVPRPISQLAERPPTKSEDRAVDQQHKTVTVSGSHGRCRSAQRHSVQIRRCGLERAAQTVRVAVPKPAIAPFSKRPD